MSPSVCPHLLRRQKKEQKHMYSISEIVSDSTQWAIVYKEAYKSLESSSIEFWRQSKFTSNEQIKQPLGRMRRLLARLVTAPTRVHRSVRDKHVKQGFAPVNCIERRIHRPLVSVGFIRQPLFSSVCTLEAGRLGHDSSFVKSPH